MSLPFKLPANYRPIPVQISSEVFTISGSTALLAESPSDPNNPATPISVSVTGSGRTRVTGSPGIGQYKIATQTVFNAAGQARTVYLPVLEFNAADNNLSGLATYYGVGTMLTTQLWEAMIWLLTPLTDIADLSALNATYPASISQFSSGRPGRTAFLTDGSMYFSDGSTWRQVSGAGSGTTPGSWSDAMGISVGAHVDSSASYSGAWAAAESIAHALEFNSHQDYLAAGVNGFFGLNSAFHVDSNASYSGSWANSFSNAVSFAMNNSASYTSPPADNPVVYVGAGTAARSDGSTSTEEPSGLIGDAILLVGFQNVASPTGYSQVAGTLNLWYRIVSVSGAQPGVTFVTDEAEGGPWPCLAKTYAFRNVNQTTPFVSLSQSFTVSTITHNLPSITGTASGSMNVYLEGYVGSNRTFSSASGVLNTVVNDNAAGGSALMAYESSSSGLTGSSSVTMNSSVSSNVTLLLSVQRA